MHLNSKGEGAAMVKELACELYEVRSCLLAAGMTESTQFLTWRKKRLIFNFLSSPLLLQGNREADILSHHVLPKYLDILHQVSVKPLIVSMAADERRMGGASGQRVGLM